MNKRKDFPTDAQIEENRRRMIASSVFRPEIKRPNPILQWFRHHLFDHAAKDCVYCHREEEEFLRNLFGDE